VSTEELPIFRSLNRLSPEALIALPFNEVEAGWSGRELPRAYKWVVVSDPERLWFAAELPAPPPPKKHGQGEFVEWLAEADDVVELFLMSADKTYQEWHISPDGAWWAMGFVGYRTREQNPQIPSGIEVRVFPRETSWLGVLSIPHAALRVAVDEIVGMQVTGAVFSGGSPEWISTAGSPSYAPDFHDLRSFRAVALKGI
jgi:hypothetical protein